ncbi:MAG: isoprenylcysteine carboxylmethyltransferase family protein [Anaerolineaceae bacterium]
MIIEPTFRLAGGILAYVTLAVVFYGIWRGTRRPAGRTSGNASGWLRSPIFYFIASVSFLYISIYFWRPVPLNLSADVHLSLLISGIILYFPSLALLLWARLVLGKMYFVSTSFGAQLYADHKLVTDGPFAFIRHPMYVGLVIAALGSLLLYHTWTTLAYALFAPFVLLRARREEMALKVEFGEEWQSYCRNVPALIPHLRRK